MRVPTLSSMKVFEVRTSLPTPEEELDAQISRTPNVIEFLQGIAGEVALRLNLMGQVRYTGRAVHRHEKVTS
jgi:hypothetical protein